MEDERRVIAVSLLETREKFLALAKSLTPAELEMPTENEGWSVKDTLAHAATSEMGLVATILRIARGQTSPRPGFDLHAFNREQVVKLRALAVDELLARMDQSREEVVRTLARLTDEELATEGVTSSGTPATVRELFGMIGEHEMMHAEEIRRAIGRR
ncbi:MAG: DinB family protein [Chloroflexi bacterium]|nr:DinB family protein [Chloroflexota bacterium]